MLARRAVTKIESEIESLQQWLSDAMQELTKSKTPNSHDAADHNAADHAADWRSIDSIQNAQTQLSHSFSHLEVANKQLDQARDKLLNAEIAEKTLEALKEERFVIHQRMWQSQQQRLSDESSLRMWMNQQDEVARDD